VPADQLSLAIGRGGQNVRLASSLTGWKINILDFGAPVAELGSVVAEAAPEEAVKEEVKEEIVEETKE
jgi:N utilization substance protein A